MNLDCLLWWLLLIYAQMEDIYTAMQLLEICPEIQQILGKNYFK